MRRDRSCFANCANCLSSPPVVCPICTAADEADPHSLLLPNWTHWYFWSDLDCSDCLSLLFFCPVPSHDLLQADTVIGAHTGIDHMRCATSCIQALMNSMQVANSNLTACGNWSWPYKSLLCKTISLKGTNLEKTGSPRCPQGVCVLYNVSLADFTSGSLLLSQSQHLRWFAILGPNIQHYWLKVCEIREVSINKFGFSFVVSSGKISQKSLVVRSRLGLIKSKWTQD